MGEVVRRNRVKNGLVYLQVTRGVASRDFLFPADTKPSLVVTAKESRSCLRGETSRKRHQGHHRA